MTTIKPTSEEMADESKWVKDRNPKKNGLYAVRSRLDWAGECWLMYGDGNWSHGQYMTHIGAEERARNNFSENNFIGSPTLSRLSWFDFEPGLFD
jgi:hypothetical protein